ncbi:hypothetical protein BT63DRAFT_426998 [Microthyrium microscopicum]|uniref:Uncharacterized protein n=1 Tax=Microthyrium microscopicum TaxID=703497 RepID=A0A6A6U5Y5_9PEZI|nr:hypothetical protein BT63DRAFT_426998 [Microthyrium microscopicum]
MNYRDKPAELVVALDFEYLRGEPDGYLNAQGIMFSAARCNEMSFTAPHKQSTVRSDKWIVPADMVLINARGH